MQCSRGSVICINRECSFRACCGADKEEDLRGVTHQKDALLEKISSQVRMAFVPRPIDGIRQELSAYSPYHYLLRVPSTI